MLNKIKNSKKMKKILLLALTLSFTSTFAQKVWEVPSEETEKTAPFKFTQENADKGALVFKANCMACHGPADGTTILPDAGNIKDAKFKADTDGELFYKITTGRGAMPSFKDKLSPQEIWDVIAFIRSYHDDYVQEVIEKEGLTTSNILLLLTYIAEKEQIQVAVNQNDSSKAPLSGIEVTLEAMRTFGGLVIDNPKLTNKDGVASFNAPHDLPGIDSAGSIIFKASVLPEGALEKVSQEQTFVIGEPNTNPSLIAERAMWGKLSKIPLWLLFTYLTLVITTFGFIGYCMLLLKKIFETGRDEIKKQN